MTILGLELDEWWALIKIVFGVLLVTIAIVFVGLFIHEGAHIFVALALGCEIESLQFIAFSSSGFAGGAVRIHAGPYLIPIAFAGGFAEGLYLLIIRRHTKSQGIWMATLSCWIYALAEIWWTSSPKGNLTATLLLDATTCLMFVILYFGLTLPRLKVLFDLLDYKDYQKASANLSIWVPSDHSRLIIRSDYK